LAVTKIKPIRTTIEKSIAYIINADKTESCLFVSSENCIPETAAVEFQFILDKARAGGNTIGRHLIQSFAPDEVTPEQAHEIGKRLADEILGGQYGYVLATHLDRGHIHNHFIWCAVNIETHRKYISNKASYHKIQEVSRIGTNINQVVKFANTNGSIYPQEMAELQERMTDIWRLLKSSLSEQR
jgi:hypothetical protein